MNCKNYKTCFILYVVVAFFGGCGGDCIRHSDCKSDLVCDDGYCVQPSTSAGDSEQGELDDDTSQSGSEQTATETDTNSDTTTDSASETESNTINILDANTSNTVDTSS